MTNKCVLCILDGWGLRKATSDNAISQANVPNWKHLWSNNPKTQLRSDGIAIGLPEGQMGNSEVGHLSIGSGRKLILDLPRINSAIKKNELASMPSIRQIIQSAKSGSGRIHFLGILSEGGVHGDWRHITELIKIAKLNNLEVFTHLFTDGRDTAPQSGINFLKSFLSATDNHIPSTLCGRFYAMDRDNNWNRTLLAYRAIHNGDSPVYGNCINDLLKAISVNYDSTIKDTVASDEFLKTVKNINYSGVKSGDSVVMTNFRADRARQIIAVFDNKYCDNNNQDDLLPPEVTEAKKNGASLACLYSMTSYSGKTDAETVEQSSIKAIFQPLKVKEVLGSVISLKGLKQLRLAETEKFAHVTNFLNGGIREAFKGEKRILVPSIKTESFAKHPKMSAEKICELLVQAMADQQEDFSLIIVNFANGDMVGHTGNMPAVMQAVETIDSCLKDIIYASSKYNWTTFITADHGNCEQMWNDSTGMPHTSHTLNPVPWVVCGNRSNNLIFRQHGTLIDIAPTILDIMEIEKPRIMTGKSLIIH